MFAGNTSWHYRADFKNVTFEGKDNKHVPKYEDVEGAPSLREFEDHLTGAVGLLVIPITKAGACRFGKIDVDIYGDGAFDRAKELRKKIARLGLPLIVELSKSGGLHLAHYSPHNVSATDMREKLADWIAALNLKPTTEIFPKQDKLKDGDPGSGINLPYFGGDNAKNYAIGKDGERLTVEQWLAMAESLPPNETHAPGIVNIEGAADLLSKHWTDGQRDNLNMAVAGTLLRAGLEASQIQEIINGASDLMAGDLTSKAVEVIEADLAAGKRVPGYWVLQGLIGEDDTRELMRLIGSKPPPEAIPFNFGTVDADWLTTAPDPLTYTIEPILPTGVVGMLVAEGGAGKTTFGLRMAIAVAGGREFFGLPTKQGRVVYIACEEHERGLRRRFHWIVTNEIARMQTEKLSPETIELFRVNLMSNLTLRSAVGYELHLVSSKSGETSQSRLVDSLIEKLPQPLELLILDPISRLNGAEENSNQVGTALVNAAERIARERECTLLLCHHTGKAAAQDRDKGIYAARGASGFVDAARSSIRLLQADANDVRNFTNVPPDIIERGDLVQVIHNKSNEGPKAEPFWLRRQQLDFEKFEPQMSTGAIAHSKMLAGLYDWYVTNGNRAFSPSRIIENNDLRKEIWKGIDASRNRARECIKRAQDDGDLIVANATATHSTNSLWLFRDDYSINNM